MAICSRSAYIMTAFKHYWLSSIKKSIFSAKARHDIKKKLVESHQNLTERLCVDKPGFAEFVLFVLNIDVIIKIQSDLSPVDALWGQFQLPGTTQPETVTRLIHSRLTLKDPVRNAHKAWLGNQCLVLSWKKLARKLGCTDADASIRYHNRYRLSTLLILVQYIPIPQHWYQIY